MMTKNRLYFLSIFLICLLTDSFPIGAQAPDRWSSSEIFQQLEKLNTVGSALYIAAHPDDENTRLISYMSNELNVRTAYLSLTRGDGGQNLVGPEIEELLGLIRTQELLSARQIDDGEQYFSRANDFGYSKTPEETLEIWNNEEVLSDVVWVIRKFRPDVIINRFDHESGGRTHGHHTASAILSNRAFDLAAKGDAFPEQLEYVDTWNPKRLFFNTSWWFYGSVENFEEADKSNMISVDIGTYFPLLGQSNTEIAARSRSMHKSQGFGSEGTRGSRLEYLEWLKGPIGPAENDIFDGIDISWDRIEGGDRIGKLIRRVMDDFDFTEPAASVPALIEAYELIDKLDDPYWRAVKLEEVKQIIYHSAGLYLETTTGHHFTSPGSSVELETELLNRSELDIRLESITISETGLDTAFQTKLNNNEPILWTKDLQLPKEMEYSNPYWLNEPHSLGMYTVESQKMRGQPESPPALSASYSLTIEETPIEFTRPVVYKRSDPVKGEVYRPFDIVPPVAVNFGDPVYIFGQDDPREIELKVHSLSDSITGELRLELPSGWKCEPQSVTLQLKGKGATRTAKFTIDPPANSSEIQGRPVFYADGQSYELRMDEISYDHIASQLVFRPSSSRFVRIDLKMAGKEIGYIMGAGDEIPDRLRQIGYNVSLLEPSSLGSMDLNQFNAIVLGIRAFNTVPELEFAVDALHRYAENGGVLIVQYNTSFRLVTDEISPYPLQLSRDRVTDEEAEMRMLAPEHPVLHYPNVIGKADFQGWVQERGLYFPDEWDDRFVALFSTNDLGEDPKEGALLIAPYGDGHFVYTGISWFRQLPAGVPGAYRLFVNLLSLGNEQP